MKSPFKFLDSYTIQDRDVFFGRKQEIDTLYEMVFQTPLLLVYGLSGTGKTSIIQCGLASRFHGPEWFPFSIRRKENLNTATHQALEKALKGAKADGSLADKVAYISQKYFRPVYLLFDQFEELFILGSREEQDEFAGEIRQLLAEELPCKVIFIMREEYLGQLYNFEKAIPTLFDFRLRIEPMSNNKVEEVIASSFEKFNIALEPEPAEERIREIITNISSEKSVIQLPYLQVYLDMLYRDDYKRTYGEKPRNGELPPLTFTQEEIRKFGNIKGVLEKFLLEQQEEIQKALKARYPGIPEEATRKVLDSLVTEEGTKHPVAIARDEDKNIRITDKKAQITLPALAPEALTDCLELLENSRLIRILDTSIELAHDTLAALIDEQRTDEQKQLNEVKRRILNNFEECRQNKEYLTEKQLNSYEYYIPKLKEELGEEVAAFLKDSEKHIREEKEKEKREAREKLEKEQKLREATERALEIQRRAARRQRILSIGMLIIAIVAGYTAFLAVSSQKEVKKRAFENQLTLAEGLKNDGRYADALDQLMYARDSMAQQPDMAEKANSLIRTYTRLSALVTEADTLRGQEARWRNALEKYEEAYSVSNDRIIQRRISTLKNEMEEKFEEYYNAGARIWEFTRDCGEVMPLFEKALALNPGDPAVLKEMQRCR